jgi:putative transposase
MATTMLSDTDLARRFAHLKTPEAGRTLIRQAREHGPARSLQRNTDAVRTRYISDKMGGRAIYAESRTVELPAIVLREKDQATLEFWTQPFTVDLVIAGAQGGRTRTTHTPDVLAIETDGFVVEEWREELRLLRMAAERPHLFHKDQAGRWHYGPAEQFFAERGLTYRLRSADELPRVFIANLHFLEDFSRADAPPVPVDVIERFRTVFKKDAVILHTDLVHRHQFNADHIFQMLLNGIAFVDLHAQRLDVTDALRVFRDETVYRADALLTQRTTHVLPPSAIAIREGAVIHFDGKRLEVVLVGTSEVIVKNATGDTSSLPVTLVHELFKRDAMVPDAVTNTVQQGFDKDAVIANSKRLSMALVRHASLQDPANAGVSPRTLRRWRKRVAGAATPQEALPLLMSHHPGNRCPRISPEVMDLAVRAVEEHHNKPTNPTVAATYAVHKALCDAAGLTSMGQTAFYKWIKSHENVCAREGRRAAYQKAPIPLTYDFDHPVHGVLPHEIVYIDHTIANIMLRGRHVDNLGKPTLTIGVDGAVSKTRAMYASFDPPSANTVLMLMRDYVCRNGRLPKTIVLDNGAEFHSASLLMFCSLFGIHIRWRRRSRPRDSSMVERMLGATEQEVLSSLEGNTIALKDPRNVSPEVQPDRFVRWTLPGLHGALEHYLFRLHPDRVHPRFGISPNDFERRIQQESGARDFVLVKYDATLKLLTSPHAGTPQRTIDNRKGVFVDGVFYWNDRLASARPREKAEVRREMWCARVVYVCFRGDWIVAQARDGGRLEGRFLHELETARRAENRARRSAAQRDRISPRVARQKTVMWIPEAWDSRLREQAMEAHYLYERLEMAEVLPEARNSRANLFDLGAPLAPGAELLETIDNEALVEATSTSDTHFEAAAPPHDVDSMPTPDEPDSSPDDKNYF